MICLKEAKASSELLRLKNLVDLVKIVWVYLRALASLYSKSSTILLILWGLAILKWSSMATRWMLSHPSVSDESCRRSSTTDIWIRAEQYVIIVSSYLYVWDYIRLYYIKRICRSEIKAGKNQVTSVTSVRNKPTFQSQLVSTMGRESEHLGHLVVKCEVYYGLVI